jgi:DNA-binding winged helix-turn-helix (wHTH) protein
MDTEAAAGHAQQHHRGWTVLVTRTGVSCDSARRQLVDADGTILHVTPKAFDLLILLMAEAPRVVRKAELHAHLWPGTFVTDAALASLVKELRRVLRDHDSHAPLIKTAHAIGYAFEGAMKVPARPRGGHWLVGPHRRYELQSGENTIGRDPDSAVWLDEVDVSRRHARVLLGGTAAVIEDVGSKNGTFVGTTRVEGRVPLRDGDTIHTGGVCLTYREAARADSTETRVHPPPP